MSLAGFLLGLGGLSMQANRGLSLNVPSPSPPPHPAACTAVPGGILKLPVFNYGSVQL